jgi:nucleoside-diphosphate-sugar epimerase
MPSPSISITDLELMLNETRSLWEEMRDQRIFLTGGTGFFGCWLLESFAYINSELRLNAKATVLTRDPVAFAKKCPHLASNPSVSYIVGDVRSFVFPDGEFKYVIHAATEASARQALEEPLQMLTTIVDGTERILNFAASHGARKFLLTSSGAVYGKQPAHTTHIPEDYLGGPDPLDPASVYAEGKRISEQMCALYSRDSELECKIARCFAFVGPHLPLDTHFAIGNFIRDTMNGGPIAIMGDGTPTRSYLYAADLSIWLWTILFRAPSMQAFNVGSEEAVSIAELAQTVVSVLDPSVAVTVAKQPSPNQTLQQYVPRTQRAWQQFRLRQTVDLSEAIRRTAAWYRQTQMNPG